MNQSTDPTIKLGVGGILLLDGKILLGKRSATDLSLPGMWCNPGGGVEFGETVDAAIVREFREETGMEVTVGTGFLSVAERIVKDDQKARHVVMVHKMVRPMLHSPAPRALDGFDEIAWFSQDAIYQMIFDKKITQLTEVGLKAFFADKAHYFHL